MIHRRASIVFLSASSISLVIFVISTGASRAKSVMAAGFEPSLVFSPAGQILPTATPQIVEGGEALDD